MSTATNPTASEITAAKKARFDAARAALHACLPGTPEYAALDRADTAALLAWSDAVGAELVEMRRAA